MEEDKEMSDDMMKLINYPLIINLLYKSGGEKNREMIDVYHRELHNITPKLNNKLNYLRYKPIIKFWKFSF